MTKQERNISIIVIIVAIILTTFLVVCFGNGKANVHYKNKDYCFVDVQIGSGLSQSTKKGTMSIIDYNKWVSGKDGTVFLYTDNKAKNGISFSIDSITSITNHGDTPMDYD